MARWLAAASVVWLLLLGSGLAARTNGRDGWATVVYVIASRVCHQRPDRSFSTAGVSWPVCGRCAGLYLAAPVGAVLALGRRRTGGRDAVLAWLMASAAPSAATLFVEWFGLWHVSNLVRFVAAIPLGIVIAMVVVDAAPAGRMESIE